MKYIIEWSEVKTTATGKEYKKITAKDVDGLEVQASVWSDAPFYVQIAPGATIEAEVRMSPDGKYKNLVMANQNPTRGTGNGGAFKTAQIEKAMDKKADQIAKAQDRSAWMWSKTNAATLIAATINSNSSGVVADRMLSERVIRLATLIYNGEPTEPFSTPPLVFSRSEVAEFDRYDAQADSVDMSDIPM